MSTIDPAALLALLSELAQAKAGASAAIQQLAAQRDDLVAERDQLRADLDAVEARPMVAAAIQQLAAQRDDLLAERDALETRLARYESMAERIEAIATMAKRIEENASAELPLLPMPVHQLVVAAAALYDRHFADQTPDGADDDWTPPLAAAVENAEQDPMAWRDNLRHRFKGG